MKLFYASCAMLLAASQAFAATPVMGADKPAGSVTPADIEGYYSLEYFSESEGYGGAVGNTLNFSFIKISTVEDNVVRLEHFFKEDAEPIDAEFDPQNLTITIPNNYYLGKLQYNNDSFEAYLALYDISTNQPELLDKDIIIKVNPDKRNLTWKVTPTPTGSYNELLFIASHDGSQYIDKMSSAEFHYANYIDTYRDRKAAKPSKVAHFMEFDADKKEVSLYNFGDQGWYKHPIVFNLDDSNYPWTMTATDQRMVIVDGHPEFTYWLTEAGQIDPFQITATIYPAEEGYTVTMPEWTYCNRDGQYFSTCVDYVGNIYGPLFGAVAPKPVITPSPAEANVGDKISISLPGGGEIRYTLDGSVPTVDSEPYANQEIIVGEKTIVKAIAIIDGCLPSFVAVADYDKSGVKTITTESLGVSVENGRIIAPVGARAFNLNGVEVDINSTLAPGLYIVKAGNASCKVML